LSEPDLNRKILTLKKIYIIIKVVVILMVINQFQQTSGQTPVFLDPTASPEVRTEDLLGRMNLIEKIGQMAQVDHTVLVNNLDDVTNYFIGSVLSGGDSENGDNRTSTWADLYDSLQKYALKTRLKIPIIYGIDAIHGNNNIYGATIFPHNIGLGCTRDPGLVELIGKITAIEVAATGIDWTFAPCIAIPQNEKWGRFYEGFGSTHELASQMGSAFIRGLQGNNLAGGTNILACAKHFLADGGTMNGVDQGNTVASESEIRNIHLPGYVSAISAGVGSIMVSYSSINGLKMHGSKYWLTDVLKKELGFGGFIVSDWAGVDQLSSDYKSAVEIAINAGIDMVMIPLRFKDFITVMIELVNEDKVSVFRIDDAVRRILKIKFEMGLFEKPFADRSLIPMVGSEEHRNIARRAVRESLVLLKRKDNVLPLPKKNTRILLAGSHADDLGLQCGGWTISWQGKSGTPIIGTTILQGMKKVAPDAKIDFDYDGIFTDKNADYAVVVVGEQPYAEGKGDNLDLNISPKDVELIKKMKDYGIPVIVIVISGRPLMIEKILHYSDAIIAAWLPGTEGEGIADILFGDYNPTGKLSQPWPRNNEMLTLGKNDTKLLYEFGYGINSFKNSPSGSAPLLLSAIVTANGKNIEMTFNKEMKIQSNIVFRIKTKETSYSNNNVLLKEKDHTTYILKLNSALSRDDSCNLEYLSGKIESFDRGIFNPPGCINVYNWTQK
jgi:beta-glucosidase